MKPDALTRLDDYLRRHDDDASAAAYEEDLFARALAGDAPELAFHHALRRTLRDMDARGTIELWLDGKRVAELRASGRRILFLELDALPAEIPSDAELVVTRVPIDLAGIRHLHVEVRALDGTIIKEMPDVPFDPADGAVWACCEAELARVAGQARTLSRVYGVDASNERRLLAEIPI